MTEEEPKLKKLIEERYCKSLSLVFQFYFICILPAFVILGLILHFKAINISRSLVSIFFGSLFIAYFTQWLHKERHKREEEIKNPFTEAELKKGDNKKYKFEFFFYEDFTDCAIRCFAGILEIIMYTFAFAVQFPELVIGYLILKTISYWKNASDSKNEGLSTAVLRIAIVLSIMVSFVSGYFLAPVFKDFPNVFYILNK